MTAPPGLVSRSSQGPLGPPVSAGWWVAAPQLEVEDPLCPDCSLGSTGWPVGKGCSLMVTPGLPKKAPHPVPRVQRPSLQTAPWPSGHPCGFGPWLEVQTLMGASLVRWNVGEPRLGCGSEAFSPAGAGGLGRGRPKASWEGRECHPPSAAWQLSPGIQPLGAKL